MLNDTTALLTRFEARLDDVLALVTSPFSVWNKEQQAPCNPLWPVRFPAYRLGLPRFMLPYDSNKGNAVRLGLLPWGLPS
ncbi:MAG: hypothetical protein RR317_00470 [Bilophila sp.]